jgi:hypothetical protein
LGSTGFIESACAQVKLLTNRKKNKSFVFMMLFLASK